MVFGFQGSYLQSLGILTSLSNGINLKYAFLHLPEKVGHTIPDVMRISRLIKSA